MPTIGIDFKMKTSVINGRRVKIQVVSRLDTHSSFTPQLTLLFLTIYSGIQLDKSALGT